MDAPAMMIRTMQDVRIVSRNAFRRMVHVSAPRHNATMIPAPAPMAAASVGVNQPRNMPPMTTVNRMIVSMMPSSDLNFAAIVVGSPAGPSFGLMWQAMPM